MDNELIIKGTLQYVAILGPFCLVFAAVTLADDLIALVKRAASITTRSKGW